MMGRIYMTHPVDGSVKCSSYHYKHIKKLAPRHIRRDISLLSYFKRNKKKKIYQKITGAV